MTQHEVAELLGMFRDRPHECAKHCKKIKENFGADHGTFKATKSLLQYIMSLKNYAPGDVVDFRSPQFTILKHWMLANCDPWSGGVDRASGVKCHCFAYTCLMPNGCIHKPGAMHGSRLYDHFCAKCSQCIRCGK